MNKPTTPQPGKRSTWGRKLLYAGGGLVLLLVLLYFVATSSAFFKAVILPRASDAIGGEVTVAEASISPFSQVTLRQLAVKTTGTEPVLTAKEVRLRYSLTAIMGGSLQVDEVTIESPVLLIVENADGTSNLDPLLKQGEPATEPSPSPEAGTPPQVALKNFALTDATLRRTRLLPDGGREIAELSGVNVTLDQLQNGGAGKLTTAATFRLTRPTNDVLEARSSGEVNFELGDDLMPRSVNARLDQQVLQAGGSLQALAGHRMALTTEITPAEIREFSQRLFKGDQLLGELKVTGPMDLTNLEGRLKVEVASIDRHVLNLVGAPLGIDFGATTLNSTTDLTLAKGGSTITANTRFDAAKFSLTQDGQTTPPLDLQLALDVAVDTAAESATVQSFTINGTQNQRPLLRASLAQPMDLAWGANATGAGDSALDLEVTNFDLAEWKAVAGDAVSKGKLSARLKLLSQQGGKLLKLALDSQIADLAANAGAEPLTQAKLILKLDGELTDFKEVNVGSYRIELTEKQQPALKVSGSAAYDGATFNLQSDLEAVMATLMGSGPETPLAAGVKLDGRFADQVLELRQLQVALSPTARAAKNEFVASGRIDLATPGMTKGNLLVNSDTLDLTDLYDAFTAAPADAPAPAPTQPAPGSSGNEEPEPVVLPLQFTVEAVLDRLFLHEIAITNLQSVVRVDGGKIALDPFRLTLNGAPVNANIDLDLGIKGYTYALAVSMDKVPLEPIANTFSPANRGKYQGFILVDANITGAGVTGASLQKNLGGRAGFSFTNANLQVVSPRAQRLLVPIATLLRLNELTQTPLNWLQASTELGGGNITLSRFAVQGEAFDARTHGTIPIAQVLTNSPLNLPVEFSLRRSLADKAGLLPANTPTNVAYATLPQFVTVSGTLGEPKSEVNKLALGGLLLKSGAGIAEKLGVKVGSEAGKVIQGVGNLLTGEKSDAAKEEKSEEAPKPNLLDLFKKPKD